MAKARTRKDTESQAMPGNTSEGVNRSSMEATMSEVTRTEFENLRGLATDTANAVHELAPLVRTTVEGVRQLTADVGELSENVARASAPRGIGVTTLLTGLGTLATWTIICGTLAVSYINGTMSPIANDVEQLTATMREHERAGDHSATAEKILALNKKLAAASVANETQHRWMADVVNLDRDWQYRISEARIDENGRVRLPPPRYVPLQGVGQATPSFSGEGEEAHNH